MILNQTFELSMVLDGEKFQKVLERAYSRSDDFIDHEEEYVDRNLVEKGILIIYRDSQYKKKVKLIVNAVTATGGDLSNTDKLVRKLRKRIAEYFNHEYQLEDFTLSGLNLSTDIDVGSRRNVSAYLKVLQRIGKVKGLHDVKHLNSLYAYLC